MKRLALSICLVAFSATAFAGSEARVPKQLHEQVQRLIDLIKDRYAEGIPPATMVQTVKLTPYRELSVVVFTVEGFGGGNNHSQYLAVFEVGSDDGKPTFYTLLDFLHIGGKGWRAIEKLQVRVTNMQKSGAVEMEVAVLEVGPDDAPNFPSIKTSIRLAFRGDRLTELTRQRQK